MTNTPALDPVAVPTLLPCPFCGGSAEFGNPDEHAGNYVFCETCGAASHWVDSTEEAGMVWNRRAGDAVALLAEVERLRTILAQLVENPRAGSAGLSTTCLYCKAYGYAVPDGDVYRIHYEHQPACPIAEGRRLLFALRGGGGEKIEQEGNNHD